MQAPESTQSIDSIQGTIEKVIYRSEENGFTVLKLLVNSKREVTVTGYLPSVNAGEFVKFDGSWGFHAKFGRQFKAKSLDSKLPATVLGIKKYLGSGLIKGIGPKFAKRLVDKFEENTLEVIDKSPERLFEVDGVGQKRAEAISSAWQEQKEISKVMVFLHGHSVSTAFAVKIYKKYGDKSISVLQENPYKLVKDIWGIGFKTADKIALDLNLDRYSSKRASAGILHVISTVVDKGDLYIELDKLKNNVITLLELKEDQEDTENNIIEIINSSLRSLYNSDSIKLILKDNIYYVTLPKYYFSEKNIALKINSMQESAVALHTKYVGDPSRHRLSEDFTASALRTSGSKKSGIFKKFDIDFDVVYKILRESDKSKVFLNEDQQKGIISALQSNISIITGGPGTGKTTLIKKLLDVLDLYKIKYRLAAPTGRASKRMFEGTGRNTETIHRLLEFDPSIMNFTRNERNVLDLDFLVVDEASMIDVFLMNGLLKALPINSHLVLLGDIDQLPSVGPGSVLGDLIKSNKIIPNLISVIRLTEIFRQAQNSLIIVNAHKVNNGEFPANIPDISTENSVKKDFIFIKENEPENIFAHLRSIYSKKLNNSSNYNNSIVLTPMNRGIVGTSRLNQELQIILNKNENSPEVSRFGVVYKVGDRVMQIRNNYTKFIFNGDIGCIDEINNIDKKVMVNFGDRTLEYDFSQLDELVLSYAVSIHKSQGSEFDTVIIPIFMQHFVLLQRNLIYTAITRAKKLCI